MVGPGSLAVVRLAREADATPSTLGLSYQMLQYLEHRSESFFVVLEALAGLAAELRDLASQLLGVRTSKGVSEVQGRAAARLT